VQTLENVNYLRTRSLFSCPSSPPFSWGGWSPSIPSEPTAAFSRRWSVFVPVLVKSAVAILLHPVVFFLSQTLFFPRYLQPIVVSVVYKGVYAPKLSNLRCRSFSDPDVDSLSRCCFCSDLVGFRFLPLMSGHHETM